MKKKLKKVLKPTKEQLLKKRIKELEAKLESESKRADRNYDACQVVKLELSN